MRRQQKVVLVAGVVGAMMSAIAAACSFPDVTFGTGGGAETGTDGTTGDGASGDGAGGDGGSSGDGAIIEAATRTDATSKIPDGSCDLLTSCDCDKDLHDRAGCDSGVRRDSGVDCDDFDPLRNPSAGLTDEPPDEGQVPKGDWNCDGRVDKAYDVGLNCRYVGIPGTCTGGPAYKGTGPGCGLPADYFRCKDLGALTGGCVEEKIDTRIQTCK